MDDKEVLRVLHKAGLPEWGTPAERHERAARNGLVAAKVTFVAKPVSIEEAKDKWPMDEEIHVEPKKAGRPKKAK